MDWKAALPIKALWIKNNDIYIYAFSSASIQLSVQVNVGVFSILISTGLM